MSHLAFGKRNVAELVQKLAKEKTPPYEWPFREILIKKNPAKEIIDSIIKFLPPEIKITYLSGGDLDSMLPGKKHQGVVLLRERNTKRNTYLQFDDLLAAIEKSKSLILVLDRIQDTGNFGNILRTAECLGVKHIMIPERDMAPINETVEKISSGALHYLHLYRVTNLNQCLETLKKKGYWTVATSDKGSEDWSKLPPPEELVLILGSEGKGVKRLLMDNADFQQRIPLHGKISSLNVTIACGISLDRIMNR